MNGPLFRTKEGASAYFSLYKAMQEELSMSKIIEVVSASSLKSGDMSVVAFSLMNARHDALCRLTKTAYDIDVIYYETKCKVSGDCSFSYIDPFDLDENDKDAFHRSALRVN